MLDKKASRRIRLRLSFKGAEVPDNIGLHLTGATYTDEEEDSADDFQMEFEDREGSLLRHWMDVSLEGAERNGGKNPANGSAANYVVQRGDTLRSIAQKHLGNTLKYKQIAQENGIKNPDLIYPGQVLRITVGASAANAAASVGGEHRKTAPSMVSAALVQRNWDGKGKDVTLRLGTFEIDGLEMSGPPGKAVAKCTSIPYTSRLRMEKKSKAWENYTLKGIGEEIARKSGMALMYEAAENPEYKRKEQLLTSDIRFLQGLCHAAGMALKVTDMTIVIFDAAEYDRKPAAKTFKKGGGDILSYKLKKGMTDTAYTSCHVSYTDSNSKETIEYTYTPDPNAGTGQTLEVNEKVSSTDEARKLARNRLREKNAQEYTATLTVVGDVSLVAGITVMLKGFQQFDRKYKVTKAKHSLLDGYTVELVLKQALEGY